MTKPHTLVFSGLYKVYRPSLLPPCLFTSLPCEKSLCLWSTGLISKQNGHHWLSVWRSLCRYLVPALSVNNNLLLLPCSIVASLPPSLPPSPPSPPPPLPSRSWLIRFFRVSLFLFFSCVYSHVVSVYVKLKYIIIPPGYPLTQVAWVVWQSLSE